MSGPNIRNTQSVFPFGFDAGVQIRGVPLNNTYSGNVYWVDSVHGSDGNKGSFNRPWATLAHALGSAGASTAYNGTIIFLKAGHAETVISAGQHTLSTAGVAVIGLGQGTQRPTFTFQTATTASFVISAAGCSIQNIVGVCNIASLANPFNVQAADAYLDIEWQDTSASLTAIRAVLTSAAASRLFLNLVYRGIITNTGHGLNAVRLVGVNHANINIQYYGYAATAVVEFYTTACNDIYVTGQFYNNASSSGNADVVDTVTGSIWYASIIDYQAGAAYSGGSAVAFGAADLSAIEASQNVPTANATTNALVRDVVGNKTDTGVTAVGTTKSLLAYIKGAITMLTVQAANSTNNAFAGDVVGNKTDSGVYYPSTIASLVAYDIGALDLAEKTQVSFSGTAATMVNGNTIFTIANGPILVQALWSVCVASNNSTASTLQYSVTPTSGSAQTISGASASLASALAGASVTLAGTALATAALLNANGPNLIANPGTIVAPAGTITMVIGTGSTTGTWLHYIRYKPLAHGVTVT